MLETYNVKEHDRFFHDQTMYVGQARGYFDKIGNFWTCLQFDRRVALYSSHRTSANKYMNTLVSQPFTVSREALAAFCGEQYLLDKRQKSKTVCRLFDEDGANAYRLEVHAKSGKEEILISIFEKGRNE